MTFLDSRSDRYSIYLAPGEMRKVCKPFTAYSTIFGQAVRYEHSPSDKRIITAHEKDQSMRS